MSRVKPSVSKSTDDSTVSGLPLSINGPIEGYVSHPKTVLSFTMTSIVMLRAVFDSYRDMPPDICLSCNEAGIFSVDSSDPACIISLAIAASDLGNYQCTRPVSLGLWTAKFSKLVRTIHSKDSVVMYVTENDLYSLHIKVLTPGQGTVRSIEVPLLHMTSCTASISLAEYKSVCAVSTIRLQKMIKDTLSIGVDKLDIVRSEGRLRLDSSVTDYMQEIEVPVEELNANKYLPIMGRYNIAPIKAFVKSSALSKSIEISMAQELPTVFSYHFLGNSTYSIILKDDRERPC